MNREFLRDKKYTVSFFLLAACFLFMDIYLFGAVEEKRQHIRQLETETAFLENWSKLPKEKNNISLLENLLSDITAEPVLSSFSESGCVVDEIEEGENGEFHVFHIRGKGSFSQITTVFDIIKSKESWTAAELRSLKREGNVLAYEVEIRAVRN